MERNITAVDPDLVWIRQIAAGDEDALRQLYDAYGQRMYAYALRITGTPAGAEEAVQESLVAIWQGAGRFRGDGRVIAWIQGIVHHKALNQVRGRVVDSLDSDIPEIPTSEGLPEKQATAHERCRLVRDGLAALPLEHRLALELVFYQGLTLSEAAEVCGCPVGTIKSRLSYARASLKGVLSRAGYAAEDTDA